MGCDRTCVSGDGGARVQCFTTVLLRLCPQSQTQWCIGEKLTEGEKVHNKAESRGFRRLNHLRPPAECTYLMASQGENRAEKSIWGCWASELFIDGFCCRLEDVWEFIQHWNILRTTGIT